MAEKVIPNCLNYADLKPEGIENEIRVVRYTPTSNINGAKPQDVVKFFLQGNGFYDPYSAYIRLTVSVSDLLTREVRFVDRSAHSFINRLVIRSQGVELERIEQYDVLAAMINDVIYSAEQCYIRNQEGFGTQSVDVMALSTMLQYSGMGADQMRQTNVQALGEFAACTGIAALLQQGSSTTIARQIGEPCFHANGALIAGNGFTRVTTAGALPPIPISNSHPLITGGIQDGVPQQLYFRSSAGLPDQLTMEFCIPIYSGIIGVLQPDKKLLPLSLMPLEVEFTLNPHALYSSRVSGSRRYTVDTFEIFAHTLFFEQEVHRALETVVAEQGLFIHTNSFTLAPVTQLGTQAGGFAQINVPHKSINSLHTVFLYNLFDSKSFARKLHFVSHSISQYQVRNGAQLLPSEPITSRLSAHANAGTNRGNQYARFYMEMAKAWNVMHNPLADGAITYSNYCLDTVPMTVPVDLNYNIDFSVDFDDDLNETLYLPAVSGGELAINITRLIGAQINVGRCQYGISLEGEDLGTDHTIISGRKAQLPFDINYLGSKTYTNVPSYMMTFVRHDAVIYVRPDLVVTVLGK